jgi:hypothetical protein
MIVVLNGDQEVLYVHTTQNIWYWVRNDVCRPTRRIVQMQAVKSVMKTLLHNEEIWQKEDATKRKNY